MKKYVVILVLGALMAYLVPANAQNAQEWQSTSAMKGAGSAYSSQITEVGAVTASEMATTTESYTPAKNGPRKMGASGRNPGDVSTGSTESPLGDALVPLMLMALGFGVCCAVRGRKERTPSK